MKSMFKEFKKDIILNVKEAVLTELEDNPPPRKKRKTSCGSSSLDLADDEISFTETELEKISDNVGKKLERKQWSNVLMDESMKKYTTVAEPLPEVSGKRMKLGNFTKFKNGMNLNYWLKVVRTELIACNISNAEAYLVVPQLIEDASLLKWAQHMIGTKELEWSALVKMLALKVNDFSEGSKALKDLERMNWREDETASNFIKRFAETFEKTQLDSSNPHLVLEYLTRAMTNFHSHEIMFVNRLFSTLPLQWDLVTVSSQFIAMMPNYLRKESEARKIKCLKCHKIGHVAANCRKIVNGEPIIKQIKQTNSKSVEQYCSKCFSITGRKLMHLDAECRRKDFGGKMRNNVQTKPRDNKIDTIYTLRDYLASGSLAEKTKRHWPCEKEKIQLIQIPIQIMDERYFGVVDSGASKSVIPHFLVQKYNFENTGASKVKLINSAICCQEVNVPRLTIKGKTIATTMLTNELVEDIIIGLDLMYVFGITLQGLPLLYGDEEFERETKTTPVRTLRGVLPIQPNELAILMKGIEYELHKNMQIKPNSCTNHPEGTFTFKIEKMKKTRIPQYQIPQKFHDPIEVRIKEWMEKGVVKVNRSKFSFPILGAPKKGVDGVKSQVRICFDARYLNQYIKNVDYPLPLIKEIFECSGKFNYFATIDLAEAFHQLPVEETKQKYLSFTWKNQQYTFCRTPFGIKTVPSFLQRLMEKIFFEYTEFCRIFIDDIIIGANSLQDLIDNINLILQKLSSFNFRIKREKCKFGFHQIAVLGHIIGQNTIRPDPEKLTNVWRIPRPQTGKQLQAFLGTINYLRQYMPYYGAIAQPLERMKCTKGKLTWTKLHDEAFQQLKNILRYDINLALPDFSKQFIIATDASDKGVGAVLFQMNGTKKDIISVVSKSLSDSQRRYAITKKELFAVIYALNKFNNYVYGRKFLLQTDHQSLLTIFSGKKENKVLNNWLHLVINYDFDIEHIRGVEHVFPDMLSRLNWASEMETSKLQDERRDTGNGKWKISNRHDTVKPIMVHHSLFRSETINKMEVDSNPVITGSEKSLSEDEIENLTSYLPDAPVRLKFHEFLAKVMSKKPPTYENLIQLHTKNGHTSANKLFDLAWRSGYYSDCMRSDCSKITARCIECVMFNIKKNGFAPLRCQNADIPWKEVHMDWLIMPNEKHYKCLVLKDICTGLIVLNKYKISQTDEGASGNKKLALKLFKIFSNYGIPQVIKSDADQGYGELLTKNLGEILNLEWKKGTPYHQQSNSSEASIRTIQLNLAKIIPAGDLHNWTSYLPVIQMMENNKILSSHRSKAFEVFFNRFFDSTMLGSNPSSKLTSQDCLVNSQKLYKLIFPELVKKVASYRNKYANQYNSSHNILPDVQAGKLVMVRNFLKKKKDKMVPKWNGPYIVKRMTLNGTYEVETPDGHVYPNRVARNEIRELPDDFLEHQPTEHPQAREVECIRAHRMNHKMKQPQFKVKWRGLDNRHNEWKSWNDFYEKEMLIEYINKSNCSYLQELIK